MWGCLFILGWYCVRYWIYHIIKLVKASLCHLAHVWCWRPRFIGLISVVKCGRGLILKFQNLHSLNHGVFLVFAGAWSPKSSFYSFYVLILLVLMLLTSQASLCGCQVVNKTSHVHHVQLYFWNCQAIAKLQRLPERKTPPFFGAVIDNELWIKHDQTIWRIKEGHSGHHFCTDQPGFW